MSARPEITERIRERERARILREHNTEAPVYDDVEIMFYRSNQHSQSMVVPRSAFYDALVMIRRLMSDDATIVHAQITCMNRDRLMVEYNRNDLGIECRLPVWVKRYFSLEIRHLFIAYAPGYALDEPINDIGTKISVQY